MHPALYALAVAYLGTGVIAFLAYFWMLDGVAPGHDMKRRHALALVLAWPVAAPVLFGALALRGLRAAFRF